MTSGDILNFDEKQVFNSTFNNQGDGYIGNITFMKDSFDQITEQYEARLKQQQETIDYLQKTIDYLRNLIDRWDRKE